MTLQDLKKVKHANRGFRGESVMEIIAETEKYRITKPERLGFEYQVRTKADEYICQTYDEKIAMEIAQALEK
jgi:hypothetical protein